MAKEQVSSILRALEILECFMDNETEWTLKRLVAQLDLPTTTVHRQLSTLTDRGYLVQDPVRKSYRVGPRLLLLSSTVLSHSDLRSTARPELEKLSATVKETINLSVMLDREIFYLAKVETFRSVVCNTKVGTRAPAHATSGGKIMLAFHDPDYVDAYCRDLPQMQRLTDRTVFSPDLLREQLAQARINGFAIDDGEIEPGLICVGAPIFGLDQTVVAAVSIAGPTFRMKEELDVIIIPDYGLNLDERFESLELSSERAKFMTGPHTPLAGRRYVSPAELAGQTIFRVEGLSEESQDQPLPDYFVRLGLGENPIQRVKTYLEATILVQAGLGIATIPGGMENKLTRDVSVFSIEGDSFRLRTIALRLLPPVSVAADHFFQVIRQELAANRRQ